jgi:hypothetical protein
MRFLRQLDGRNRPFAFVTPNRNAQSVQFIEPNEFNGPGFPVTQYDGFTDKLGFCLV